MRVKEESEKAGLKLNIQKTKIMASSPITSWQIEREKMETVTDFIFLGSVGSRLVQQLPIGTSIDISRCYAVTAIVVLCNFPQLLVLVHGP